MKKNGISLIVLIITIVVIIILAAAVILTLTGTNPIDSSKVAKVATNHDNMSTDIGLFINNAKIETKAYFTTEEILSGTGSVRKGIKFEGNDKVEKNDDGTSNAKGYKLIASTLDDFQYIKLENQNTVKVYKISNEQYKALINSVPSTPTSNSEWYIDIEANVYLVYDTVDDIPKWLRGKAKDNSITDNSTLAMFLGVKSTELPED